MKKLVSLIAIVLMLSVMLSPQVSAWSYGNPAKPDDGIYEQFGPRADKLLINLYSSELSEWTAGLEGNKIDVTDWPLYEEYYNKYITAPWNATVKVIGYGAEFGLFIFDLNNNNNQYLGNPPNPAYPNPVYPNPMSELALRKAVAYLTNRPKYVQQYLGETVAVALYTPVPPSAGKYSHPDITPGGAREDLCYLYNPAEANATLDAGGFPLGPDGWRYWDKNRNSIKDAGEDFTLKIVARVDSYPRSMAGADLTAELTRARVKTNLQQMPSGSARIQVMANKNFHIYTGGWSLGVDPDFLVLWHWDYYWHPGRPYNYAGCNVPAFNEAADGVQYANDQAEAVYWALRAQEIFATNVLSVPLWTSTGFKAVKRTYTGTPGIPDDEDVYEGKYWEGFVNVQGYGVDSGSTFMNMHPEGVEWGNMTIRYGFKTQEIKMLNPVYAEWLWDNTVIDLIGYDSLLTRNPYNLGEFLPWVASKFRVGTYTHPTYGECTKVIFALRPGVEWSDGTPVTMADIYFTFVEIDDILAARGLPPPWWISNVQNILSFSILDAYNFEVLLDVKSVFAIGWCGGNRILPKHIWKPICETGDPTTFAPDPNMINSGAWRLVEYVENSHVLLTANGPDKTVTTNLAGATAVTSDMGFFRYTPIIADVYIKDPTALDHYYKVTNGTAATVAVDIINLKATAIDEVNGTIRITGPTPQTINFGPISIGAQSTYQITVPITFTKGVWRIHVDVWWPDLIGKERICPITGARYKWHWCRTVFWATIKEDLTGSTWYDDVGLSTYPYKTQLLTPDIKVDVKDVAKAAKAFGARPGDARWDTLADIIQDYKIDVKDIAGIAKKFGWK